LEKQASAISDVSYWLNNVWLIPHFAIHQMPRKLQMITAKTTQMTMVSLMTTIAASRTLRVIPRRSPRTKRDYCKTG